MSAASPVKKTTTASKPKSSDVLSRLTDPSKYTGAHKHRFDEEGKGRGLAGKSICVYTEQQQLNKGTHCHGPIQC